MTYASESDKPNEPQTFQLRKETLLTTLFYAIEDGRDRLEDYVYAADDQRVADLLSPLLEVRRWVEKLSEDEEGYLSTANDFIICWDDAIRELVSLTSNVRMWAILRSNQKVSTGGIEIDAPWGDFSQSLSEQSGTVAPTLQSDAMADLTSSLPGMDVLASDDLGDHPKTVTVKGQKFFLVSVRPHTRRDGTQSTILVWKSICKTCGVEFEYSSPRVIDRSRFVFNCQMHRNRV